MAMKKADLKEHAERYENQLSEAALAERNGFFRRAVQIAWESCRYVDGMMHYRERYEDAEFSSIRSLELILKLAPLLFDFDSLNQLEPWLKDARRVEKRTSDDLAEKIADARKLMWDAHRMWGHTEASPGTRQDQLRQQHGGDQDRWRGIAEKWERMGLLQRTPSGGSYELSLITRMGQIVSGKCSACGTITQAPKAMFLEDLTCPKCSQIADFVLLA